MGNPFQIYGPFEVSKARVAGKEYQKAFWDECDRAYPHLSEAKGLYVFSLRNGANHSAQYVGITKRDFTKEVFNNNNLVKILDDFAKEKGTLAVHPATLVPIEGRMITLVEDAHVATMRAATKVKAVKELV